MTPQTLSDLEYLRTLCLEAHGNGPRKWFASADYVAWVRTHPDQFLALLDVARAAFEVQRNPGGLSHSRLYEALGRIQGLRRCA